MNNLIRKFLSNDTGFNFEGGFGIVCIIGAFFFGVYTLSTCVDTFEGLTFLETILLLIFIVFNSFISMINIYFRMKYPLSISLVLSLISGILISNSIYLSIILVLLTTLSILLKRLLNLAKK